jgi:small subunit ribosomal protein S15
MALTKEQKLEIISQYGKDANDTGSTEVQIALLTIQINALSAHLQNNNKKDFSGQRGLLKKVGQRKRLLSYLERTNYEAYKALIKKLGLRH